MYLTFTLADGSTFNAGPLEESAIVGRSKEAGIALPSDSLSAQHAVIEGTEDGTDWQIRDLDSANGISDGTNQAPAFLLTDGATVYLGDVRMDVSLAVPVAPVSQAESAHAAQMARLRAARPSQKQSGSAFLFIVLGVLAFGVGVAARFIQ